MKTAEEILNDYWALPETGKSNVIYGMKEYARQTIDEVICIINKMDDDMQFPDDADISVRKLLDKIEKLKTSV